MKKNSGSIFFKILGILLGVGVVLAGIITFMVVVTYPKLPSMDELRNYQPKLPLQVYSEDGVLLGQFGQEHRIFLSINQTPKLLKAAILSAEDERFYQHGGIDLLGIIRAALANILSGHLQSGASTITQQVARNFFLTTQKTFTRKFNEVLLSYKIEESLTKDQILELYINQIYLGQRAYGFAEASLTYFGKPIDKLTTAEYAVLASLPKAPSAYNPVVNPQRAKFREIYVLGRMLNHGYINQQQYDEAQKQSIIVIKGTGKDSTNSGGYIAEMARQYLYPTYGEAVYTQGFKVYTTINSKMQQAAYQALRQGLQNYDNSHGYRGAEAQITTTANEVGEQFSASDFEGIIDFGELVPAIVTDANNNHISAVLRNGQNITISGANYLWVKKYLTDGGNKQIKKGAVIRVIEQNGSWQISQLPLVQGALVAINPNDGALKALIGGFDYTNNNFNHVMQARRQPGSSFKPFIYSAALDKGYTGATIIDDDPICFSGGNNGSQWCPKNDDGNFLGPISLRQGLTLSRNIITIKILNDISPQYAIDYVNKFGFDKTQFQPYLTMGLGANEVTPMQMAQAFSVFANGGYLIQPYFIAKILDHNGNIIAKTNPINLTTQQPAIDPRNAYIINDILKDVAKFGTGARAYKALQRNDVAGKTGTTNDAKDVWFDGYTPDLVAVTWVGYDQPKTLGRQFGATLALPIWIDFMKTALHNIPQRQLVMPNGIRVQENSTWKGTNEYFMDGTDIKLSYNESNINASEPITEGIEASSPLNYKSENHSVNLPSAVDKKQTNIDDLIKNIQD